MNNEASLGKLVSLTLFDDQVEVGQMTLKMKTFMLLGAKVANWTDKANLSEALEQRKENFYPIFKDQVCTGHLKIETQFIGEDQSNSSAMVFEGGLDKPDPISVKHVRKGLFLASLATAITTGLFVGGMEDEVVEEG